MRKILKKVSTLTAVCLTCATILLTGTGCSKKAGVEAPALPARHWLDDAPGIPVENKAKYDAAIPNLYDPAKKFRFEDCVYLTIQQSPQLVHSAVDIEIKRLAQTDSTWKYLPEPRMRITVSENITRFNEDAHDAPGEYGKTQFEIGFYAPFPNPVATYFETKAQMMLTGIAISTHRKAVGEAIYRIAEAYLRLQAKQYSLAAQRSLVPVAHELTEYWKEVVRIEGNQGAAVNLAQSHEREVSLAVEKAEMEEVMQRTQLKVLAGVDPQQAFSVDATDADRDILRGFSGNSLRWEDEWTRGEDNLILKTQIKLADYNIMLAWAAYVPNMSLAVDMTPPRGQAQPASGIADHFVHLSFDFPLIDWGRRYRGVQTARMGKAQAFHTLSEKRYEFSNKWLQAQQKVALALTNMKLAQTRFKTAQMQYEEARIGYEHGIEQLPVVAERQEGMVLAQIDYINAELEHRLAKLNWMYVAGLLQRGFLGLPDPKLAAMTGSVPGTNDTGARMQDAPAVAPVSAADSQAPQTPSAASRTRNNASRRPIGRAPVQAVPAVDEELVTIPNTK